MSTLDTPYVAWMRSQDIPVIEGYEYEDEDPEIRRLFDEETAKHGVKVDMPKREERLTSLENYHGHRPEKVP